MVRVGPKPTFLLYLSHLGSAPPAQGSEGCDFRHRPPSRYCTHRVGPRAPLTSQPGNGTQAIAWGINEEYHRKVLESGFKSPDQTTEPSLQIYYGSLHDVLSFPCEVRTPLVFIVTLVIVGNRMAKPNLSKPLPCRSMAHTDSTSRIFISRSTILPKISSIDCTRGHTGNC